MISIARTGCLMAALLAVSAPLAVGQQQAPSTAPAAARDPQAIGADLSAAFGKFRDAVQGGAAFRTAEAREKSAGQVLPLVDQIISLFTEMGQAQPAIKDQAAGSVAQFVTFKLIYGDPTAMAATAKAAAGTGADAALAQAQRAMAEYLSDARDAARDKAIDEYDAALKAAPDDQTIQSLLGLLALGGTPSTEVVDRLAKVAADNKSEGAQEIVAQLQAEAHLKTMENKPLTIEAVKLDGAKFSSADWKGKVILVDFWATWCGPCMAEMPRVKAIYKTYHDKGLEVVGVSCDNSGDELKQFLAANPDVAWPQLFDVKKPGWNAVATSYGVLSIPHMFLIDRKGILRSVEGREEMEDLVPQLLAEKTP